MKSKVLLTPRQQQVLKLVNSGKTNKEISSALNISLHTVKWHVQLVYKKLGKNVTREKIKNLKVVTLKGK